MTMVDTDYELLSTVKETQFSLCMPKRAQPCVQYDPKRVRDLAEFVMQHGGAVEPVIDSNDQTAFVQSMVKESTRTVYVTPGSWVRCIGPGQFSAVSDVKFRQQFNLV